MFKFLEGTTILFSTGAAPFYAPAGKAQVFPFLHILPNTFLSFYYNSHPDGGERGCLTFLHVFKTEALTAFSSRLHFQGCLYSEQP